MPTQRIQIPGVGVVEFPETMTEDAINASSKRLYDDANAPEPRGVLGAAWDTAKSGGAAALEAIGRPLEFVVGTAAGGFQDPTRGLRAAFEPLVGGTQHETVSNLIQEKAPEFAKAHPWATAGLGFAGDVFADPLNLLGGAGLIRSGLLKGAKGLGVAHDTAKTWTGLKIGEAFQGKVVPALAAKTRDVLAKTPLVKLMPDHELSRILDAEGISGRDVKRFSETERQAIIDEANGTIASILKRHAITPEEKTLLSTAMAKPGSAEAAAVAADPTRLGAAAGEFSKFFDTLRGHELGAGVQEAEKVLEGLSPRLLERLQQLPHKDEVLLKQYLRDGDTAFVGLTDERREALTKLASALEKQTSRKGQPMVDLRTFGWTTNADGDLVPTVSTRVPNYVPQRRPDDPNSLIEMSIAAHPKGRLKAANERTLTWDEAVALGSPTDIAEIAMRRASDSARARASSSFLTDVYTKFAQTTPREGYRELRPSTLEAMPDALRDYYKNGVYIPKAIADEIERVSVRLRSPEYIDGVVGRSLKVWKTLVTSMNLPTHPVGNFVGNSSGMYIGGMSAPEIATGQVRAIRALNGTGKVDPELATFIDEARAMHILGEATGLAGELRTPDKLTPLAETLTTGKANPLNPDAKVYQWSRDINQKYVEDPSKLAMYAWARRTGKTPEQAALLVKKHLFDYSDLTDFEKKHMRDAIPFYTWTRKNVPLQLATLVQNPARLSHQRRVLDMFNELATADEETTVDQTRLPDYMQSPEFFQLPTSTAEGQPVMGAARLPMFDLNLLTADPQKLMGKVGFMLNPLLRIPLELGMGERLGTGAALEGRRPVEPAAIQKLTGLGVTDAWGAPRTTTWNRYVADQIPLPFSALARTTAAGMDEKADIAPFLEFLLRSAGVTPVPVTPNVLRRAHEAHMRDVRANRPFPIEDETE